MDSDLIAWVVAGTLGLVVVVLGLRRNLSETTRNGLPRFGGDPEGAVATLGLYEGEEKRRPLSPRQRRWIGSLYLLIGLWNAVQALLSADDRLFHAIIAPLWMLAAVMLLLGKWPLSARSASG